MYQAGSPLGGMPGMPASQPSPSPAYLTGGGGPALNPLAAALMQGAMPSQAGAPPGTGGGQLLQTGGAVPGAIPLGAPTNQFGAVPNAPPPVGQGAPPMGAPMRPPMGVPVGPGAGAPIGRPAGAPGAAGAPFGFGGMRPQGY
jgi:hypothetical protein